MNNGNVGKAGEDEEDEGHGHVHGEDARTGMSDMCAVVISGKSGRSVVGQEVIPSMAQPMGGEGQIGWRGRTCATSQQRNRIARLGLGPSSPLKAATNGARVSFTSTTGSSSARAQPSLTGVHHGHTAVAKGGGVHAGVHTHHR